MSNREISSKTWSRQAREFAFNYGGRIMALTAAIAGERALDADLAAAQATCSQVSVRLTQYYYLDKGGQTYADGSPKYTNPKVDPSSQDEIVSVAPNRRWQVDHPYSGMQDIQITNRNGEASFIFRGIPADAVSLDRNQPHAPGIPAVDLKIRKIADRPEALKLSGAPDLVDFAGAGTDPANVPCNGSVSIISYAAVTPEQANVLKSLYGAPAQIRSGVTLDRTPVPSQSVPANINAQINSPVPSVAPTITPQRTATPDQRIATLEAQVKNANDRATQALEEARRLQEQLQAVQSPTPIRTNTPTTATPSVPRSDFVKPAGGEICIINSITSNKQRVGKGELVQISVYTTQACNEQRVALYLEEDDPVFDDPPISLPPARIENGRAIFDWKAEFPGEGGEYGVEEFSPKGEIIENPRINKTADYNVEVADFYYPDFLPSWVGWTAGPVLQVAGVILIYDGITHLMNKALHRAGRAVIRKRFKGRIPVLRRIY